MSTFHRIAIVAPKGDFNNNMLPLFAAGLGSAFEARGLEVALIDSSAAGFQGDLLRAALDPATAVYVGHFFYDLGLVHADEMGHEQVSLFEAIDRPVFARLADHPFGEFMWDRIQGAAKTTHFLTPSLEFEPEARLLNPALEHFHHITPSITVPIPEEERVAPLAQRPIDIFMPCSFKLFLPSIEEMRQHYGAKAPHLIRVIDETLEVGLADRDRPIMQIFFEAIKGATGLTFQPSRPLSQGDKDIVQILSSLDFEIRTLRRRKVVENLAKLNENLRIVVTIPEAERQEMRALRDKPNIELIDRVTATKASKLYLNSKYVINVNPTYVSLVSERVRNAMAFGCCVVSDRNRHIAETFEEGQEILFMDEYDPSGLGNFFDRDPDKTQGIASQARQRVLTDFPISRLADDIIAVMRKLV